MDNLKKYVKGKLRKSTPEEHDFYIGLMSENLHNKEPKVGIFWYNPDRNELFGVVKLTLDSPEVSTCSRGLTCKILHKQVWQKELRRLKYKEKQENTFPYIGRYEDKPRGRVFYKDGVFQITVGSWINDHENYRAIELIEKEFDITNEDTEIVEDSHWDVGCGWDRVC